MASEKRYRSKQLSHPKTEVLKEMMEIKQGGLTSKHSSGGPNPQTKKKTDKIWADITETVNAVGNCPRMVAQVKEKWRNMMKQAKADYTAERVSLGKTGGGPALPEMSQTSLDIVNFLKESASFSGIPGANICETVLPNAVNAVDETDKEFSVDEVTVSGKGARKLNQSGLSGGGNAEGEILKQPKSSQSQSKPKTLKELQMEYYQQAIAG